MSSTKSSAVSLGYVLVHRPHQTPTIDTPFTSVKFRDIFGIDPFANPITKCLPLNAVARNACSEAVSYTHLTLPTNREV